MEYQKLNQASEGGSEKQIHKHTLIHTLIFIGRAKEGFYMPNYAMKGREREERRSRYALTSNDEHIGVEGRGQR